MKYRYDPESQVSAEHWLSLDESERIDVVETYHRRTKVKLPNVHLHATFHAVVETQITMGDQTEAEATLKRLLAEGLDRHNAIHAIADVLTTHIYHLQKGELTGDPNETYSRNLRELNASQWLKKWEDDTD